MGVGTKGNEQQHGRVGVHHRRLVRARSIVPICGFPQGLVDILDVPAPMPDIQYRNPYEPESEFVGKFRCRHCLAARG